MNFEENVIKASFTKPILAVFWANWCGPCKVLIPVLKEAEKKDNRWGLTQIDVDQHLEMAKKHEVMGVPKVILFQNGESIGEFYGFKNKEAIIQFVDQSLKSPK